MLFERRFWPGLADGTITVAFRRWKRPHAKVGTKVRTPAGVLEVDGVDVVTEDAIDGADAGRAGFGSRDELVAELDRYEGAIHRVAFHFAGPDPRAALRERVDLSDDDLERIAGRLARMDRTSRHGPWTVATLSLIAVRPQTRAADLAASVGRETLPFKTDVRKLKELGLTESLETGYRLSRRGRVVLTHVEGRPGRLPA